MTIPQAYVSFCLTFFLFLACIYPVVFVDRPPRMPEEFKNMWT